ncbi:HDOD domain-containing protein [Frigoriglobus tundricola]|uniref:HDOD domain-containing protein n=1 Tax=Frigoriglobus tundricola TaxID=2774151 RepID=A0A6M5YM45_9BACT|nr:HDOD domain-containing protein [Frigoriglobus tundricola]QJW94321.1 hypothetical protein FTUN_1841 [Frigoriglobus tundricola]
MAAKLLHREPRAPRPDATAFRQTALADLDRVDTYPTLSDTALRVMGMVNNSNVSVAEVSGIVRRDGVLVARVLRAANSCTIRGRTAINDVQQAVLRMGLQECANLLAAAGVRAVYAACAPAVRARCDALLRHSLFVGRLAAGFSRSAGVGSPGPAFTAGLLHDIGRVVLCVKCNGVTDPDVVPVRETDGTIDAERAAFGIDHCAIGYQFATRNGMPENVVRVTLNHHRPDEEHIQRELVALVAVAERIGNYVQREHQITGYDLGTCPHYQVLADGWTSGHEAAFARALPAAVVRAIRDTRHMLKAIA